MDPSHKVVPPPQAGKTYISNIAEITVGNIEQEDKFMIIACDGLWDEMTDHEAASRVAYYMKQNGKKGNAAQALVEYALDKAARRLERQEPDIAIKTREDLMKIPPGRDGRKYLHDDITVIIIFFEREEQE